MAEQNEKAAARERSANIDAILNRHRVNLAKSQKLVESWLPLSEAERKQSESKKDVEVSSFESLLRPEL